MTVWLTWATQLVTDVKFVTGDQESTLTNDNNVGATSQMTWVLYAQ